MFGLGIPEIVCILLIAVIVLGPEHAPRAAHTIGKWSAKIRSAATGFEQAIAEDSDLREIKDEVKQIKSDIDHAKKDIVDAGQEVSGVKSEIHDAYAQAQSEMAEVQAVAGRAFTTDADTAADNGPGDSVGHAPEPSPFLSKPLDWFGPKEEPAPKDNTESPSQVHIALARPKFLPGPEARRVSYKTIALEEPRPGMTFRQVPLDAPKPGRACCRIRPLRAPNAGTPSACRHVELTRHG